MLLEDTSHRITEGHGALPSVSVILPIRNEAAFIDRSLGAILAQDYPAERMEILIADGMSTDGTLDIIRAMPGAERVTILENPAQVQAAGLNLTLAAATGDIIVRVDGHAIIAPDYVRACVETLAETGADNVGGIMKPAGLTPMGSAIALATSSKFGIPTAFHRATRGRFTDTVYLGAWPRTVFARVGTFDASVHPNEDYELNYRIRSTGGKIYLSPRINSIYYGRQTLHALAVQYFRYGQAKTKTLRKAPRSLRLRQLAAPALVAFLVLGPPLAILVPWVRLLWLGVLLFYLLVASMVSLRLAKGRLGLWWRAFVAFPTLHLAWGLGFWKGLFRRQPVSPARAATVKGNLA